jgi:hypothetical protein
MPTKVAVTDPNGDGIQLESIRRVMDLLPGSISIIA